MSRWILSVAIFNILKQTFKSTKQQKQIQKINIPKQPLTASAIPSSKIARLFEYSSLAAQFSWNSNFKFNLNDKNTELLVSKLSHMRGAALKVGQMLSIQDNDVFPAHLKSILSRVQNAAQYMPIDQLNTVLEAELGPQWRLSFEQFEDVPVAAASIGQVHSAVLKNRKHVAVKVQYPGVAASIDSDLSYLKSLVTFSSILPKGLFLDNTIKVARRELGWECDYIREAESTIRFRKLIRNLKGINVPKVYSELSTSKVLVTDFLEGVPIGHVINLDQETRNSVAERLLRLCLDELFVFRFMQTDPNWSNFLYQVETDTIHLLDFGAAREFSKSFTDKYLKLLLAGSIQDKPSAIHWSRELGFLTGLESDEMNNAHVSSLFALALPFSSNSSQPFEFGSQKITDEVRSAIPTMLKERLTPPPDESYSLHRKLSGCFLLCTRLKAKIDCAKIFREYYNNYSFDNLNSQNN